MKEAKTEPIYSYPLLRLMLSSIVLAVVYLGAQYGCVVRDWMDSSYYNNSALLLHDLGTSMAQAGAVSGLYIALQLWLVQKYTVGLHTSWRWVIAVALLIATTFLAIHAVQASLSNSQPLILEIL